MYQSYLTIAAEASFSPNGTGVFVLGPDKGLNLAVETAENDEQMVLVPKDVADSTVEKGDVGYRIRYEQLIRSSSDKMEVAFSVVGMVRVVDEVSPSKKMRFAQTEPFVYDPLEVNDEMLQLASTIAEYAKEIKELGGSAYKIPSPEEHNYNERLNVQMRKLCGNSAYSFIAEQNAEKRIYQYAAKLLETMKFLQTEQAVDQKVRAAMQQNHEEFRIRQQIRALNEELGEEDEAQEYLFQIMELDAPQYVKDKLNKEARRLYQLAPVSPDMALLKNYLDTMLALPWNVLTEDNEDLSRAREVLDSDHYGLEKVKERLIEALAVRKLSKDGRSPIICLVGPPGIGKTSIARSIAEAMNKKYVRLSFGGVRDEAEIRGHRKTYVGAMPGRIISSIQAAGSRNPVFLMDEIDKMASDYKGDPASALLEVLDPEQNVNFRDHFVEMPFDLSKVLFITTANSLDTISRPLLDRMEIIEMSGYTVIEKKEIAKRHLIRKAESGCGLKAGFVKMKDEVVEDIILNYTRESGVRGLEKQIGKIMRKVALEFVEGKAKKSVTITQKNLTDYLGIPKYTENEKATKDQVGVATGLAWTSVGGDTLPIEVLLTPGKGELLLTGSLGDVMKESARIALSVCRSKQQELGLEDSFFQKHDIHIHVPEGATPKDGPSAGITIATALVSALSQKKVDHRVAMTGELTLRGHVLPIGGLKEKTLAAMRAGIQLVFVPKQNKKDYSELPNEVKDNMEFCFVDHVDDVLKRAILR